MGAGVMPLTGLKVEREVWVAYGPNAAGPHVERAIRLLGRARASAT